jgi:hypothetical protein
VSRLPEKVCKPRRDDFNVGPFLGGRVYTALSSKDRSMGGDPDSDVFEETRPNLKAISSTKMMLATTAT